MTVINTTIGTKEQEEASFVENAKWFAKQDPTIVSFWERKAKEGDEWSKRLVEAVSK